MTYDTIRQDIITAMKAGDRTRLDVLRMLANKIALVAKNDGNRDVTDEDVITGVSRYLKETRETRDILVSKGRDYSKEDAEIAIVSDYAPKQIDETELRNIITSLYEATDKGKSARGMVMKGLNGSYRGQFDPSVANRIVAEVLV
jgi:uncharacterized protein YqeY